MGRGMPMHAAPHPCRVADEIVLFARDRILEEGSQSDRAVVHGGSGGAGRLELQGAQPVDDDRLAEFHAFIMLLRADPHDAWGADRGDRASLCR